MSVRVTVRGETYIDISNGGWERFLAAVKVTCGDIYPDLCTRDVYCEVPPDRCEDMATWGSVMRGPFVASTSDKRLIDLYDEVVIALEAGAEMQTGIVVS